MKNFQKGSVGIIIIIVIALLAIGGGTYYVATKKAPESTATTTPKTNPINDPNGGLKTYSNVKYGFSFKYPNDFRLEEDSGQTLYPSLYVTNKPDASSVSSDFYPILPKPNELGVSISVLSLGSNNPAELSVAKAIKSRANTAKYSSITIGDKNLMVQRSIPGAYDENDELIWLEPAGNYVVLFVINSNTTLVSTYSQIISNFKFTK